MMTDKAMTQQWWFPQLTDATWVASIRDACPEETAGLDDDGVRDEYADGNKYADTWDHLGDARYEYEKLADAYLELLKITIDVAAVREVIKELRVQIEIEGFNPIGDYYNSIANRLARAIGEEK